MLNKRVVYSNDLLEIIKERTNKFHAIKTRLDHDDLINQGLFLMATTYFEATLREIMSKILTHMPEKLKKDKFTLNKYDLCSANDFSMRDTIVENELFNLFKGNVKEQLLYNVEIVSNIKIANLRNESSNRYIMDAIKKCSDISIYRNCLIHNAGKKGKDFDEKVEVYKIGNVFEINLNKITIEKFIDDYLEFFSILDEKINKNRDFKQKTKVEQLRQLWNECFNSPLLKFENYWEIDEERDLITGIKYSKLEHSLSSSEKVYLSIWRHQFYDPINTEEFLLVSINEDTIYKIHSGLSKVKFNLMYQEAH